MNVVKRTKWSTTKWLEVVCLEDIVRPNVKALAGFNPVLRLTTLTEHKSNTIERALAKMSKYQVMEFNDTFTRNRIIAIMKPYLASVQAGRGIQDFHIICDTSNNTPDVISRNQLVVDIYIKPTYVSEMISLHFVNAGTNDFSSIINTSNS